jgi:hypothetical protein
MPREYFGCLNLTFGDWRNTETVSEQTRGSKRWLGLAIQRRAAMFLWAGWSTARHYSYRLTTPQERSFGRTVFVRFCTRAETNESKKIEIRPAATMALAPIPTVAGELLATYDGYAAAQKSNSEDQKKVDTKSL